MSEKEGVLHRRLKNTVDFLRDRSMCGMAQHVEKVLDEAKASIAKALNAKELTTEMQEKLLATGDNAHAELVNAYREFVRWFGSAKASK